VGKNELAEETQLFDNGKVDFSLSVSSCRENLTNIYACCNVYNGCNQKAIPLNLDKDNNFCKSNTSPVATEGSCGLSPSKQSSKLSNLKYETLQISGVSSNFQNVKPPCTNTKLPH